MLIRAVQGVKQMARTMNRSFHLTLSTQHVAYNTREGVFFLFVVFMRNDVEPVVLQTWSALYQYEMLKSVHSA